MSLRELGLALVLFGAGLLGLEPGLARAEGDAEAATTACLLGADHLEAGRYAEAADAFWAAIEADRQCFEAHVGYQEASRKGGTALADMKADYDSFIEDYPNEVEYRIHRLRLDAVKERLEALKTLRKKHSKASVTIDAEIGYTHLLLGETSPAMRVLKGPAKKGDLRATRLLVTAYARGGKAKDAARTAKHHLADPGILLEAARASLVAEEWEVALGLAEQLLALRKNSTAALLVRAEAHERMGKRKEAIAALLTGRRTTDDAVAVLLALAGLIERIDDDGKSFDQAAGLYDAVLAKDEDNARALYGLAWVREQQEQFKDAEKLYRKAAELLPSDPSPIESVGYILFLQGKIGEAQAQFKRAIDLDPTYASAYANLGATFDARAEYSKAISMYEKLLRLPGEENNIRAIVNCAFDCEQLGNFKKAETYLKRALKIKPKDADLHVWLGDNYYFQEKWRDAEKTYLDAIALDEKSFFAWRGLGMTFGQQEKWGDAAEALERARKLDADDTEIRLILGGIYLQELENLEMALECFEEYVELGGNDPDVPPTIEEIKAQLLAKK